MLNYIIRRVLLMVPTLLGVLAVVFFIMAAAPGGFGGITLGEEGSQTAGQDARRIQQQFKRRYGLDLPITVQFGRWLNQVSPVGFEMSADLTYDDDVRQQVADVLDDAAFATRPAKVNEAVNLVLQIAAYTGDPPVDVAQRLRTELEAPQEAMGLFDLIDVHPLNAAQLQADMAQRVASDRLAAAQDMLLRNLAFEASGRSRVLFDRPTVKTPDLGVTLRGRYVLDQLLEALPVTLLLNALSLPLFYIVAIVTGLYAARHRGGAFDVGSSVLFIGLWSFPVILAGVLVIGYLANVQHVRMFPTSGLTSIEADSMTYLPRWTDAGFERGYLLDVLWHLVLPVFCLTYGSFAVLSKVMRGAILDNLSSDYVRTARAKGVSERHVLWRHAFRNSVLPLITIISGVLPALFAGSVIIENIFSLNGLGKLGVEAAFQKDRELVMGTTLLAAMLGLASQLLRDVLYAMADPRVSYE